MNPAWNESDAYAETIIGDEESGMDSDGQTDVVEESSSPWSNYAGGHTTFDVGFPVPRPSQPSASDLWAEEAFPLRRYIDDIMRMWILVAVSRAPGVEYKLDGKRYNLWVMGPKGEDLLQDQDGGDHIERVDVSAPRSTYQVNAKRSIKHFERAAQNARLGRRQTTWSGTPTFEQTSRGYTVRLKGIQRGIGPMKWTLTQSEGEDEGEDQAWGGWSRGHSVLFGTRFTDSHSREFACVIPAGVIMDDVSLRGIQPTTYIRAGEAFNLWVVSDEGHNLLKSLEGCENISIKISSQSRTNDESTMTLRTFAAYSHKYERNKQGAFGKCWTGDDHVSRRGNNVDTVTIKLKGYQPGENLLGWTVNAPEHVWPGWYEKHMVEITYSCAGAGDPRTAKAAVTLQPIELDVD